VYVQDPVLAVLDVWDVVLAYVLLVDLILVGAEDGDQEEEAVVAWVHVLVDSA
jgi:hypothetical protein